MSATLSGRLEFEYDTASVARGKRGFDASQVKGVVANLVTLRDPTAATALEAAAGGKLYNVIVDTADTGAALLKYGRLRKRVTIIPLDKIQGGDMTGAQLAAASRAAGDHAKPALSLVGYEDEVSYCQLGVSACE